MLDELPPEIKDHILKQVDNREYQTKPNTYSVTELLYCIRKAYYKRTNPKPLNLDSAFNIYRGRVFDELWTPLFRHHQVRCTYRCKNIPITISGKYDFLTSDNPPILADLKTTKNLYFIKEPAQEYVNQVRFYAYLNSITKAQLIYIDFGDAKVFPIEVGDCTYLIQDMETRAAILYNALQYHTVPPKMPLENKEFLCMKCEYQTECSQQ